DAALALRVGELGLGRSQRQRGETFLQEQVDVRHLFRIGQRRELVGGDELDQLRRRRVHRRQPRGPEYPRHHAGGGEDRDAHNGGERSSHFSMSPTCQSAKRKFVEPGVPFLPWKGSKSLKRRTCAWSRP